MILRWQVVQPRHHCKQYILGATRFRRMATPGPQGPWKQFRDWNECIRLLAHKLKDVCPPLQPQSPQPPPQR